MFLQFFRRFAYRGQLVAVPAITPLIGGWRFKLQFPFAGLELCLYSPRPELLCISAISQITCKCRLTMLTRNEEISMTLALRMLDFSFLKRNLIPLMGWASVLPDAPPQAHVPIPYPDQATPLVPTRGLNRLLSSPTAPHAFPARPPVHP
jgi:hypothetical protein